MGHSHHFLSRLDRLSLPHVELALSLYNDAPMLKFILAERRIPEQAERAAICLGPPDVGPHLIVTRDGRFVTALAEGMAPHDVHLVTRSDLDEMATRVSTLRERIKVSERLDAGTGHVDALLKKIYEAGPRFFREDLQALAGLHPWMRRSFFCGMVGAGNTLIELRGAHAVIRKMPRRQREDAMRSAWQAWWAMNHFMLLVGADDGWDVFHEFRAVFGDSSPANLTWPPIRTGVFAGVIRGAWLAGRVARGKLDDYAAQYRATPITKPLILNSGFGLLAMAAHRPALRERVIAALDPGDAPQEGGSALARFHHSLKDLLCAVAKIDLVEAKPFTVERGRAVLRSLYARNGVALPEDAADEAIPADIALAFYAQFPTDALQDPEMVAIAASDVLTYAALEPEEFLLPRERSDLVAERWSPAYGEMLFAPSVEYEGRSRPARAPRAPGRNDPCHCGSGQKFKKCCLGKGVT